VTEEQCREILKWKAEADAVVARLIFSLTATYALSLVALVWLLHKP